MKNIYIVLTRSNTLVSKLIYAATGARYTHAALAMEPDLTNLASFGRKQPDAMFPAGYVRESIYEGIMGQSNQMACAVYRITVSEKNYRALQAFLSKMDTGADQYHYSILGLITCFFGQRHHRQNHYFCSGFVAYALQTAGIPGIPKDHTLVRPMDFTTMPNARLFFEGTMDDLRTQTKREPVLGRTA